MQRMIEEIEKASATLLLFFLSLSELLQDMLDLADKETQGFSWRGEWLALPNEGPSPKTKDKMYLICLVFAFPARCQSCEDKDGVVSQNDFMIFMKDAGGQMVLSTDQRVQSVEIFLESSRCC